MRKYFLLFIIALIPAAFFLSTNIYASLPVLDEVSRESTAAGLEKGDDMPVPSFPPPFVQPSRDISSSYNPPPFYTPGVYLLSLFDKKGSAYIAGKIVFDEADKEILRDFSFIIPGKEISLLRVVHEKWSLNRQCDQIKYYPGNQPEPVPLSAEVTPAPAQYRAIVDVKPNCYQNYVSVFTSLSPESQDTKEGLKVNVKAKVDLAYKNQESLLFLYRTKDYARKLLTNYYYHLPTPQIPITASSAQVGILVKEGLRLRGTPLYPNYGSYLPNFRALEKARNLTNEENQELAAFSSDIMYQGSVRKTDSDLDPDSSFIVNGIFGSFWPFLYLREVGIVLFVIGFILVATILILKFLFRIGLHLQMIIMSGIVSLITSLIVGIILVLIFLFLRSQGVIQI